VFKLVLERDRKRKALTERPRAPWERPSENDRYVPDAVKRAVWERDQGRCTWPMGMGSSATRRTCRWPKVDPALRERRRLDRRVKIIVLRLERAMQQGRAAAGKMTGSRRPSPSVSADRARFP
jgi:hypothetical protein